MSNFNWFVFCGVFFFCITEYFKFFIAYILYQRLYFLTFVFNYRILSTRMILS